MPGFLKNMKKKTVLGIEQVKTTHISKHLWKKTDTWSACFCPNSELFRPTSDYFMFQKIHTIILWSESAFPDEVWCTINHDAERSGPSCSLCLLVAATFPLLPFCLTTFDHTGFPCWKTTRFYVDWWWNRTFTDYGRTTDRVFEKKILMCVPGFSEQQQRLSRPVGLERERETERNKERKRDRERERHRDREEGAREN